MHASELIEGVEVITNKVLGDIRYLVSNAIEAEILSHLSGLACGGGSESSLHEAMLKTSRIIFIVKPISRN